MENERLERNIRGSRRKRFRWVTVDDEVGFDGSEMFCRKSEEKKERVLNCFVSLAGGVRV